MANLLAASRDMGTLNNSLSTTQYRTITDTVRLAADTALFHATVLSTVTDAVRLLTTVMR